MSNTRKDLETSAFWDGVVCLDCDALHPEPDEDQVPLCCPDCGSDAIYPSALVLKCADAVEE